VPVRVIARTLVVFADVVRRVVGGLGPATIECTRPGVSGWPRLTSAVCGEYARKLLRVKPLHWSRSCSLGTVNPSRKLRRFESFTCHRVRVRASDLRKRGRRPSSYTWRGYRKRPRFGGHQVLGSQACDLRKRLSRVGRRRGLWGMRGEVGVPAIVLAGLPAR